MRWILVAAMIACLPAAAMAANSSEIIKQEIKAYHTCRGGNITDYEVKKACELKDRLELEIENLGCIFHSTPTEAHNGGYYICHGQ